MGDSRVRVVIGTVRDVAVPVILRTSFIDMFVKGVFSPERKIVPCNSKPVPIFAVHDLSEKQKDKIKGKKME